MSCFKCDLSIKRTNVVLGDGNKTADIMIIGEAPGYHEDKKGIPFIGNSGTYLRGLLKEINIDSSNAFITNVVKCRPPNNRTPDYKEISICMSFFLSKEIQVVDPVFIITAGKIATNICTGQNLSMHECNGKQYKVGKRWVIPIFHPSYILQNEGLKTHYEATIKKVGMIIDYIRIQYIFEIASNFNKNIDSPF